MLSPLPITQSPNEELAAEIALALRQEGLINADDQTLCEQMLNGTKPADASAWKFLLEYSLYANTSDQSDAH